MISASVHLQVTIHLDWLHLHHLCVKRGWWHAAQGTFAVQVLCKSLLRIGSTPGMEKLGGAPPALPQPLHDGSC